MPSQSQNSALGAFLKALQHEKIDDILIGAMAAIRLAPLSPRLITTFGSIFRNGNMFVF